MNSIINHILISMPHMQDPYFNRSVIFMCEHDKDGAMGLIVNKPFKDPTLKQLFDSFYDDTDGILNSVDQIYFGGPVMVERGIVLHSGIYQSKDSIKISDDFFISSHKKTLEDISEKKGPNLNRLILGHSGWSGGQLEREIENGDWLVQETSPDFIFNMPENQMWEMAICSFGIDIADFSSFGGQA
ncbi:MAG: YqgE/AlgH family protein [Candidatus Marinimicrobia bacterium]|nr:YqgE/AlgH family protein [Candidatus Neomarinimicrobiota bacterium]MDP6612291.1 YqgE/AlgH family protein [Candidatus Neomarinimicrobiota bacterium]